MARRFTKQDDECMHNLRYVEEWTIQAIATHFTCSINTVYAALRRHHLRMGDTGPLPSLRSGRAQPGGNQARAYRLINRGELTKDTPEPHIRRMSGYTNWTQASQAARLYAKASGKPLALSTWGTVEVRLVRSHGLRLVLSTKAIRAIGWEQHDAIQWLTIGDTLVLERLEASERTKLENRAGNKIAFHQLNVIHVARIATKTKRPQFALSLERAVVRMGWQRGQTIVWRIQNKKLVLQLHPKHEAFRAQV